MCLRRMYGSKQLARQGDARVDPDSLCPGGGGQLEVAIRAAVENGSNNSGEQMSSSGRMATRAWGGGIALPNRETRGNPPTQPR